MNPFIEELVGEEGAKALKKASEINKNIEFAILAKSILSWIDILNSEYNDNIPGTSAKLTLKKSENGFSGKLNEFEFNSIDQFELSGIIAVALDLDEKLVKKNLNNKTIKNIETSIEALVKTRQVQKNAKNKKWWQT